MHWSEQSAEVPPLIASRVEALTCLLGFTTAVVGWVGYGVYVFSDKEVGLGIGFFLLMTIGMVLYEYVLNMMRRRRSKYFPTPLEGAFSIRRSREARRRSALFRSLGAAFSYVLKGNLAPTTASPPAPERAQPRLRPPGS
jgi:hypothetical protein